MSEPKYQVGDIVTFIPRTYEIMYPQDRVGRGCTLAPKEYIAYIEKVYWLIRARIDSVTSFTYSICLYDDIRVRWLRLDLQDDGEYRLIKVTDPSKISMFQLLRVSL
jgi:hypothetical protein